MIASASSVALVINASIEGLILALGISGPSNGVVEITGGS